MNPYYSKTKQLIFSWTLIFFGNLLLAFLVAALDETLQLFTGRSGQISDVLLDFSGALTAIVLVTLVGRIIHGKKTSR